MPWTVEGMAVIYENFERECQSKVDELDLQIDNACILKKGLEKQRQSSIDEKKRADMILKDCQKPATKHFPAMKSQAQAAIAQGKKCLTLTAQLGVQIATLCEKIKCLKKDLNTANKELKEAAVIAAKRRAEETETMEIPVEDIDVKVSQTKTMFEELDRDGSGTWWQ